MSKNVCLVEGCINLTTTRLCGEHWFTLPLDLRRKWWDETNFGKNPPPPALMREIKKYHEEAKKHVSADNV